MQNLYLYIQQNNNMTFTMIQTIFKVVHKITSLFGAASRHISTYECKQILMSIEVVHAGLKKRPISHSMKYNTQDRYDYKNTSIPYVRWLIINVKRIFAQRSASTMGCREWKIRNQIVRLYTSDGILNRHLFHITWATNLLPLINALLTHAMQTEGVISKQCSRVWKTLLYDVHFKRVRAHSSVRQPLFVVHASNHITHFDGSLISFPISSTVTKNKLPEEEMDEEGLTHPQTGCNLLQCYLKRSWCTLKVLYFKNILNSWK